MSIESAQTLERSTFDRGKARVELERWLAGVLPAGANPSISELDAPKGAGASSETLLFDATWTVGGERRTVPLVGRTAPRDHDVPIFPKYDISGQFHVQKLVGERSRVPVPRMRWLETDPAVLGAPFYVMDRVEGRVPADMPPYTLGGWLLESSPSDQARLAEATVRAIAGIHQIEVCEQDVAFLQFDLPGATPLERHVEREWEYYRWVTADGVRHPLLERAFAWVEKHWPEDKGELGISWGDSRLGNIMFDGFEPVALFDWEVVAVGPPELDVGYLCFFHAFHQDLAARFGGTGMPNLLTLDTVAEIYERATGRALRDLRWFYVYAALRFGIVMARFHRRSVHFGQATTPEDPDDMIPYRQMFEALIS